MVALLGRPEGDYVVTSTARGLRAARPRLALLVLVVVTVPVRRRSAGPLSHAGESGSFALGT